MRSLIALCALTGLLLGSPVAAQNLAFNSTNTTNVSSKTESSASVAIGADGGGCPVTSVGFSKLTIDAVVFSHAFGRCPGLQNSMRSMGLANMVEARFGKAAGNAIALQDPRIRKAVEDAGVIKPATKVAARRPAASSSVASAPRARSGGGNPLKALGALFGGRMEPFQPYPTVTPTKAEFARLSAFDRSELCAGQQVKASQKRQEVLFELPAGASCS